MRSTQTRHWIRWGLMWLAMITSSSALGHVLGDGPSERWLLSAAFILIFIALAHSILGERFVLRRLFRRPDLPALFGDRGFTAQTLRLAWHLFSIALMGIAAVLVAFVERASTSDVIRLISVTAALSALLAVLATRGRHLVWAAFTAVSIATWLGS